MNSVTGDQTSLLVVMWQLRLQKKDEVVSRSAPPELASVHQRWAREGDPGPDIIVSSPDTARITPSMFARTGPSIRQEGNCQEFGRPLDLLKVGADRVPAKLPPRALEAFRALPGVDLYRVATRWGRSTNPTS